MPKKISKSDKEGSKKANSAAGAVFHLPETADISYSSDLYKNLAKLFEEGPTDLAIDCSKVKRITTPCVQIILSAAQTLESQDKKFSLDHPSEDFCQAFFDLGLVEQFNKWSLMNG